MRILVIDDDPIILSVVSMMFRDQADVDCTNNAARGLELLQENSYDYILLDYKMPEHDGIWFMENAKIPAHTKTILITGYADKEMTNKMSTMHVTNYVLKPFEKQDLLRHMDLTPKETQTKQGGILQQWHKRIIREIKLSPLIRQLLIGTWHIIGIYLTYYLSFWLRFDGDIPLAHQLMFWNTLPIFLLTCLLVFTVFKLYSGMWAYFSMNDLVRMVAGLLVAVSSFGTMMLLLRGMMHVGFPRSVLIVEFLLMGFWMGGGRLAVRYFKQHMRGNGTSDQGEQRILIVGKIEDADLLVRATRTSHIGKFVGIVTDTQREEDLTLHGIRIRGTVNETGAIAASTRADCILILPPFNKPRNIDRIVDSCSNASVACTFRTIPALSALASGELTASSIRNVDIEDLLGRDSAHLDRTEVRHFIKGKKVMITGAGGSIGQELCRQIANYEPDTMLLFEYSEYALYTIDKELQARYPNLNIIPIAGDIRHPEEARSAITSAGGIDVIYHAAAYKHVPLMEQNVSAAFRTNVLGTARLADVAIEKHVDRFVMISSDKAVHPTSIMGATKRIAERVINEMPPNGTTFVSVRFGNVLESSGSVVPLFKKQIAEGGPVTVTSPDVRRFFMTLNESVDLVLLAGTAGRNGEIMVLEMGKAIRIVDLAKRLIELSGLIPEKDIEIRFTGLRPGEKEYEEVMTEDENVVPTSHEKIWVFKKDKCNNIASLPKVDLDRIQSLVEHNDCKSLRALAREYVPENHLPDISESS